MNDSFLLLDERRSSLQFCRKLLRSDIRLSALIGELCKRLLIVYHYALIALDLS
jgi:hypothetical protein